MTSKMLSIAIHSYGLAGVIYLVHLLRQSRTLAIIGRVAVAVGLVVHGASLLAAVSEQGGIPTGLSLGLSLLSFLLLGIFLGIDLVYRRPVMGAFVTPLALAALVPALMMRGFDGPLPAIRGPLLPVHITVAILGMAAFAMAAGVAVMYLLMERQVKAKRFGLLFSRLPPLQLLDEMNRWLVLVGFIALSVTVATGALFIHGDELLGSKVIVALVGWLVFAGLINARYFAGWRGKRVALLTLSGFCLLLASFLSSYDLSGLGGGR
jgi:ABC-type uncharacterized transport system permease subunit